MIRSATYHLRQNITDARRRLCLLTPFIRLSTEASSTLPPPQKHFNQHETQNPKGGEDYGKAQNKRSTRKRVGGSYEEEQARVLRAALSHVPKLGWSESAMISGARDVGVSPSIVGSFRRREAALVEFFMDDCLQRLVDRFDSGMDLNKLILSERLSKLVRSRLELQAPYISKWPQALSIQVQPMNFPTCLKQRAVLVDEIWHTAGDHGSDLDWYLKRTVLGGIYSTSELYMTNDQSSEFFDTWNFLEHRIRDAFDLQKTLREAAYLAEAVGNSMGSSMLEFMKRLFQG